MPRDGRRGLALQPWRRAVSLAVTLAIALLTAPISSGLGRGCQLCPPTCPMHVSSRAAAPHVPHGSAAQRPTCHGVSTVHHAETTRAGGDCHRLSRPPCGTHGAVAGVALAPMILPSVLPWRVVERVEPATPDVRDRRDHAGDPPDTPPPITAA